jgi:hypothetical protein
MIGNDAIELLCNRPGNPLQRLAGHGREAEDVGESQERAPDRGASLHWSGSRSATGDLPQDLLQVGATGLNGHGRGAGQSGTRAPTAPTPRSSMRSSPVRSRSRSSTRNCTPGSGLTAPCATTRPSATELRRSSSPNGPPNPNTPSITHLLDEYKPLTRPYAHG